MLYVRCSAVGAKEPNEYQNGGKWYGGRLYGNSGDRTYCSDRYFNEMVRKIYDARTTNPCVCVSHLPQPGEGLKLYGTTGGMTFEGAHISSWSTNCVNDTHVVGFTMDRQHFSLPLREISQILYVWPSHPSRREEVKDTIADCVGVMQIADLHNKGMLTADDLRGIPDRTEVSNVDVELMLARVRVKFGPR